MASKEIKAREADCAKGEGGWFDAAGIKVIAHNGVIEVIAWPAGWIGPYPAALRLSPETAAELAAEINRAAMGRG